MIKFKKVFSIKVISLFISVLFFLNSTVYGIDTPIKSYLRVPVAVNSKEGRSRLIDLMKQVVRTIHISLSPAAAVYCWRNGRFLPVDVDRIIVGKKVFTLCESLIKEFSALGVMPRIKEDGSVELNLIFPDRSSMQEFALKVKNKKGPNVSSRRDGKEGYELSGILKGIDGKISIVPISSVDLNPVLKRQDMARISLGTIDGLSPHNYGVGDIIIMNPETKDVLSLVLKDYDEKVIILHTLTGTYYFISGSENQIRYRDHVAGKNLFYDWRRLEHRREIQKIVIENPELMNELMLRKREHPAEWLTFQRNWELSRDPEVMKSYLHIIAGRIWHFFDTFVDAKHPFPPDYILEIDKDAIPAKLESWQEIVVYEGTTFLVERKISPTNIGFYMASILCAWQLGLIDKNEAQRRMDRTLTALEKIKTFKGMTFNWLDESFQPIYGGFISTVDSGNLAVILMFLQIFFPAYEERIDKLLQAIDFDAFFDHEKELFYSGGWGEGDTLRLDKEHWYDFFASESLLLNLAARVLKKVNKESWTKLALRKDDSILPPGAVWMPARGTMFEGTLWGLFIDPNQLNPEMRRGLKWYIDQQIKDGYKKGIPWGLSECAVQVEGKEHNYAVKYGGTQIPTLSAFPDAEWADGPPSPYSTFLALVLSTNASEVFDNLHWFEERGTLTPFGFCEALGIKGLEGRSMFFAHHQGMSLMALTNYYFSGLLQKVLSNSKYNSNGTIEELLSQPSKAYSVWGRKPGEGERTDRHGYPEKENLLPIDNSSRAVANSL